METIKLELIRAVNGLSILTPTYKAEVEYRSAHLPVIIYTINATKVDGHTETAKPETVDIDIADFLILALVGIVVLISFGHI